jgi:hypothetical protein
MITIPPLVYIAGPYRNVNPWIVEQNIRAAEEVGMRVAQLGAYPIIPHSNTRGYFGSPDISDDLWLGGTLQAMRRCDAALFLPTWINSSGARAEHEEAERLKHIEIFGVAHLANGEFAAWVKRFCDKQHISGELTTL